MQRLVKSVRDTILKHLTLQLPVAKSSRIFPDRAPNERKQLQPVERPDLQQLAWSPIFATFDAQRKRGDPDGRCEEAAHT